MAEPQGMNTIIHAAVRRDLKRFADALQAPDATDPARAAQLLTAFENFQSQLHHHHEGEETIFWPALLSAVEDPSLLKDLGGEHEEMAANLDEATAAMRALADAPSQERVTAARDAVATLTTSVEDHFRHEEAELEPIMLAHLKTPPMRAAAKQMRKSQSLAEGGFFMAWLMDGGDPVAHADLARTIPRPALMVLTKVAGRKYGRTIARVWSSPRR